ncbi:hypothetical protein NGM33_28815 [Nocardiopsis dassonvillei]|uniref:hypothetical protein n=1 Tax=Nocardiopsis dassonvillei TaxID=2014 RepID=UPI0020A237F1|nr:hypothetical protein [Nocardiopsis dassonvillei]MCP3017340.1 hypothetical protein [Nocardiopsis dassonvillei]
MSDLANIEKITRNLDEYIQQRAEQIAAPRIRQAEADAAKAVENANQAALSKISTHTQERRLIEALMAAEGKHDEPMTAHQLARELLDGPDVPVTVQRLNEEVASVANYLGKIALLVGDDEIVDIPDVW